MRVIALGAIFAASAYATQWNAIADGNFLSKRQDSSFQAPETTKQGENCTEAFGAGYETCMSTVLSRTRFGY